MNYPEKIRNLDTEELLLPYDTTVYTHIDAVWDYDDSVGQKSLTLEEETNVMIEVTFYMTSTSHGCGFIEVSGADVASTGNLTSADGDYVLRWYGKLDAGNFTIHFPCSVFTVGAAGYGINFKNIRIGRCNVEDTTCTYIGTSFIAPAGVTDPDAYTVSLTAPPARKCTQGTIKKYVLMGQLNLRTDTDTRQINFVNIGGSTATGVAIQLHDNIVLNSNLKSWAVRRDNYNVTSSGTNPTYEGGAYARFYYAVDPRDSIDVTFQTTNNLGANKTVAMNLTYVWSPWIVADEEVEVFSFDKALTGSTVRIVIEPFLVDTVTKYLKIGKDKVANLSPCYYATSSGAGILTASYTFETLRPACLSLYSYGEGSIISAMAVDLR